MSKKIIELADKLKSKIYSDYNAGKHTWFRTGGNAKIFAIVEDNLELEIILNEINNENFYIIGSGSNLLIRDNGYNGTLIKLGKGFNTININDNKLEVGASILDINLSNYALRQNIEGFEFYSGIPGSIGGAVKMNAGCYGSETVDVINSIEICDNFGQRKIITKDKLNLKYRSSKINNTDIVTKAIFNFNYGDQNLIKEKINEIKNKRLESQPIKNKTSGSTFKNPKNLHAAKLIEEAGCKGTNFGDAYVSDKHANFLINMGSASATDIENLGKSIVEKVYAKFNVKLEWEVKIIGE